LDSRQVDLVGVKAAVKTFTTPQRLPWEYRTATGSLIAWGYLNVTLSPGSTQGEVEFNGPAKATNVQFAINPPWLDVLVLHISMAGESRLNLSKQADYDAFVQMLEAVIKKAGRSPSTEDQTMRDVVKTAILAGFDHDIVIN
jgi:hypothetical protein